MSVSIRLQELINMLRPEFAHADHTHFGSGSGLNMIIRFSRSGAWVGYPITATGFESALGALVDYDTIFLPACQLTATSRGDWPIPANVEFTIIGMGQDGTILEGNWPWGAGAKVMSLVDLGLIGLMPNSAFYGGPYVLIDCQLSFVEINTSTLEGHGSVLTASQVLDIIGDSFVGLRDTTIFGTSVGTYNVWDGIYKNCFFYNSAIGSSALQRAAGTFYGCRFNGSFELQTFDADPSKFVGCHFESVIVTNDQGVVFNAVTFGAITNRDYVHIEDGSHSGWDIIGHESTHASDIQAATLLRHLPAPSLAGNLAVDQGTEWLSFPVSGDATLAANGALTVTGIGGVPSTAFWLLAGRAGGQIGYGGTLAGNDATIRGNSVDYGTVYIQDLGGAVEIGGQTLIAPTSDVVGLTVRQFVGGSAHLQEWQTSGSAISAAMSNSGAMRIFGSADAFGTFMISGNNGSSFNSAALVYGLTFEVRNTGAGNVRGINATATSQYAGGAVSSLTGGYFGTRVNNAGCNLASSYALYAASPTITAGTIYATYGLYVATQSGGTLNYAIYTNAGNVLFNDRTSVENAKTDPAATQWGAYLRLKVTATAGAVANPQYGSSIALEMYGAQNFTGVNAGAQAILYHYGSGTSSWGIGLTGVVGCMSTGNITNARALYATTYGTGAGVFGSITGVLVDPLNAYNSGPNTISYGVRVSANTAATGLEKYGLYMGSISGASSLNYAIYTNAGSNYFGDRVGIKALPSSSQALYVYEPATDWASERRAVLALTYATLTANNSNTLRGIFARTGIDVGAFTLDTAEAGLMQIYLPTLNATISNARSCHGAINVSAVATITSGQSFRASLNVSAAATITAWYGYYVAAPTISGGPTLTALHGVYVADITGGGSNYSLVTNAGNVVLNEGGNSASDTRAEGDTDQYLLFVDASADMVGIGVSGPTSKLDVNGDIEVGAAHAHYFGDPTTNDSWRLIRSGNNFEFQRRESGSWVTKQIISA